VYPGAPYYKYQLELKERLKQEASDGKGGPGRTGSRGLRADLLPKQE